MGNADTKRSFKQALDQLGSPGSMKAGEVTVWDKLLQDSVSSIQDVFSLLPSEEIRKFMFHVLKSSNVLEVIVPILHYLIDACADHSKVGLMHIGK